MNAVSRGDGRPSGRPRRRRRALWLGLAAAVAALSAPAPAQQGAASPATEAAKESAAALRERREAIAARRAELREGGVPGAERGDAAASDRELQHLDRLDRLLAREQEALERSADLVRAKRQMEGKLAAGPGAELAQEPPYRLAVLDALRDVAANHQARLEAVQDASSAADDELRAARAELERRESVRRLAKEAAGRAAAEPVEGARLRQELRAAEREEESARARFELAQVEQRNAAASVELARQSASLAQATLAWVEERLRVSEDDLREPLSRIEARTAALDASLDRARRELADAERELDAVDARLSAEAAPGAELLAERAARQAAVLAAQRRAGFLDEQLQRLASVEEQWERRYRMLTGAIERSELREWEESLESSLADRARYRRLEEARLAEVQVDLERARESAAARAPEAVARWRAEQVEALELLARLYRENLRSADEVQTLSERTLEEIRRRTGVVTLADRIESARRGLASAWTTELATVEDSPITVGKVVSALSLIAIGFFLSRLLSRLLWRLLLRRSVDAGAAAAFQGLAFYFLLLVFFLLALRTVNIPLTAFTILGGAFAIGVGFGSQNLINNFISGLILLAERPIKVGDMVEIEGTTGTVEGIGTRSTRIRTFDNIHLIVPNSTFLETTVTNWTLSDTILRSSVEVGVAYGSPTRDVDRLLHRALEEHGRILEDPAPVVLFTSFGDNALVFEAYFWIRVRDVFDRRRIQSDVRHRIDHLFREAGITVAFPQRDVHLDASRPLDVRVLPPAGPEAG